MGGRKESQNRQTKEKKEKESLLGKSQVAIFFFFFKSKQRNADSTLSRQSLLVGQTENWERAGAIINYQDTAGNQRQRRPTPKHQWAGSGKAALWFWIDLSGRLTKVLNEFRAGLAFL